MIDTGSLTKVINGIHNQGLSLSVYKAVLLVFIRSWNSFYLEYVFWGFDI